MNAKERGGVQNDFLVSLRYLLVLPSLQCAVSCGWTNVLSIEISADTSFEDVTYTRDLQCKLEELAV